MPADIKMGWGDQVEENDSQASPSIQSTTTVQPDGTVVVVEYRLNDQGKKVKVTRKIRKVLVKQVANHDVVERKKLRKFGDDANAKPGPDPSTTTLGEVVLLKLTQGTRSELPAEPDTGMDAIRKAALARTKIACRICKGDHFTSKCPFRDTHQSLAESTASPSAADSESGTPLTGSADLDAKLAAGKYVPPSLRNRGPGELPPGHGGKRDDGFTLRVTNLSEEATDHDLRHLFSAFGSLSRVALARDRETNMCKGYAFISFHSKDCAERAMEKLHGYGYDNLILRVEWAK